MKRTFLFLLFFSWYSTLLCGQKYVFSKPNKLSYLGGNNSEISYPILSLDGNVLFFVKTFDQNNIGGVSGGQDIWFIKRDSIDGWDAAINLLALNNDSNNVVVGRGNSDSTLYLLNTYSNPNRWNYGIAYSTLTNKNEWDKPRELDIKFRNKGFFRGYYIVPEEDIILVSTEDKDSYGQEDLYIYRKENDEWQEPIHLDSMINTEGVEMSPFLASDGKTLFFSSDGHDGVGGLDIFMTKRLDDTWLNWSQVMNVGKEINSSGFDAYLTTYEGGETYFVSNQGKNTTHIYSSTLTILKEEAPVIKDTIMYDSTKIVAQKIIEPKLEPEPKIELVKEEPVLPKAKIEGYTVQIIAVPVGKEPTGNFFKHVDQTLLNMTSGKDGLDRFYVGEYINRSDALVAMRELRNYGYEDAFVRNLEMYNQL